MCIMLDNACRMLLSFLGHVIPMYLYGLNSMFIQICIHVMCNERLSHINISTLYLWLLLCVSFYYLIFISHLFCFEFYFYFVRASCLNFYHDQDCHCLAMFFCFMIIVFLLSEYFACSFNNLCCYRN